MKKSNGQIVYEQLEKIVEKTGVPRQIISDHGTDIKSGIEKFCQVHKQTCFTYDIKHKGAGVLKRELENDQSWKSFIQDASKTSKNVQQTPLAHLAPPNQRSKARYLNVDTLVKWGRNTLTYFDSLQDSGHCEYDLKVIRKKLGWLLQYRDHLAQWQELIDVVKLVEEYIKFIGLYPGCHIDLSEQLDMDLTTQRANNVRNQ